MKIKYHDDFPKLDHRAAPSIPGRARWNERFAARPQGAPWGRRHDQLGNFQTALLGELLRHQHDHERIALRPVVAPASDQPDANGITPGHEPVAVVLDLVNQIGTKGRTVAGRWEAGFDNATRDMGASQGGVLDGLQAALCPVVRSRSVTGEEHMSAIASDTRNVPTSEPRPIIPPLAGFYSHTRDLSWLVVRLTAGGMLLVHGIMKVMPMIPRTVSPPPLRLSPRAAWPGVG